MNKTLVIHGPKLNLHGTREPHLFGSETLQDMNEGLVRNGRELGADVDTFQSNHEGAIVERIHQAMGKGCDFIIIKPAAFTHTGMAARDALAGCGLPFIEVHISNSFSREKFRKKSLVSDLTSGTVTGFGSYGCRLALMGA